MPSPPLRGLSVSLREARGAGSLQATAAAQPVPLQTHALFNPTLDYVDFLLAALMPAVIQLMAAAATTYAVSLDFGPGRYARVLPRLAGGLLPALLGKLLPYTFLFMLILSISDIGLYGWLGVPLRGSLLLMGVGAALFIIACQLIGALCFLLTRDFARAVSFVGVILAPALGYMGIGFPREAMPPLAQAWSGLIPGTWYIQLRIDQSLRATPMDLSVWPVLYLLAIAVALGLIVLLRLDRMRSALAPATAHTARRTA